MDCYLVDFYIGNHHKVTTRLTFDSALSFALRYDRWIIFRVRKVGHIFIPLALVARSAAYRARWSRLCYTNVDNVDIDYLEGA